MHYHYYLKHPLLSLISENPFNQNEVAAPLTGVLSAGYHSPRIKQSDRKDHVRL